MTLDQLGLLESKAAQVAVGYTVWFVLVLAIKCEDAKDLA